MKEDELKKIKNHIEKVDEEYLVLIANRGLYKRAQKEWESKPLLPHRLEKELTVEPEEGIICHIGKDMKSSSCSCPSLKVCKHLLVSLLFLKENFVQIFGEEEERKTFDSSIILALSAEEIIKKIGTNRYNDILFRLSFGGKVEFKEAFFLEATFPEEGIHLKISPENPWKESLCSCKKENCPHLVEALIRYQRKKDKKSPPHFPYIREKEVDRDTVETVRALLQEIVTLGLSRLPESLISQLERNILASHIAGLSTLEKALRRLGEELENYFSKKPTFSLKSFRETLVGIHILSCQLLESGDDELILSQMGHRSSYVSAPPMSLCGLGSAAWETKSGYKGITTYFLNSVSGLWYSFTQSRPTYLESENISFSSLYEDRPWKSNSPMKRLAYSQLQLHHPQVNREHRLSGSEETGLTLYDNTDLAALNKYFYTDWLLCFEDFHQNKRMRKDPVLLKINHWDAGVFDKKTQTYSQSLYDRENRQIQIYLDYEGTRKTTIHKLEKLTRQNNLPSRLLVKLRLGETHLWAEPLVYYGEEGNMMSLTMGEE